MIVEHPEQFPKPSRDVDSFSLTIQPHISKRGRSKDENQGQVSSEFHQA